VKIDEIEGRLRQLVSQLTPKLTEPDLATINDYMSVEQWGLAFTTLCGQLDEYQTPLPAATYYEIAAIGSFIGVDDSNWKNLVVKA
jgi:hypothetical protein